MTIIVKIILKMIGEIAGILFLSTNVPKRVMVAMVNTNNLIYTNKSNAGIII